MITTENTTTLISQNFMFATNADFIDQEIASDLDAFVSVLEKHPLSLIKVDGYADPRVKIITILNYQHVVLRQLQIILLKKGLDEKELDCSW